MPPGEFEGVSLCVCAPLPGEIFGSEFVRGRVPGFEFVWRVGSFWGFLAGVRYGINLIYDNLCK